MKRKLLLSLCVLLLIPALLLAGCGGGGQKAADTALTIATNAEFEPFEFMDGSDIVGFDIDLINEIAQIMGVQTVTLSNMEFDGVVAAVQSGTCQAAISGLTVTPKREQSVIFSIPYYSTTQVLITRADDAVFTGAAKEELDAQLAGKTIGVCAGFTGEAYVNGDADMGFAGIADANVKIFDNISLAVTALKNNSIDVIVMDSTVALNAAAASGNTDIKVIDVVLTTENYAIAINKNDTALKAKIDEALQKVIDSGKLAELYTKWEIE